MARGEIAAFGFWSAWTVVCNEATLISGGRIARVDILKKHGTTFELIEVKAKSVDTSTGLNPFRGKTGGINPKWAPYLEDVAFQFSVLRQLFPEAEIIPYPKRPLEWSPIACSAHRPVF